MRPGGRTQALVPLQEDGEDSPVAEAGPPDSEVLHEAQVLDLVAHDALVKLACGGGGGGGGGGGEGGGRYESDVKNVSGGSVSLGCL